MTPDVPAEFRATKKDYYKSGYQRGHLAPSADHKRSQAENDGTFLLSNIAPQNGPMNMGFWQRLEDRLRNLARTDGVDGVWTFTGTLFMPDKAPPQGKRRRDLTVTYKIIGPNHVPVPTHFYKAVLVLRDGNPKLSAFIVPNTEVPKNTPFQRFSVTTDYLEHWSGLDFWNTLEDEEEGALESEKHLPWDND